MALGPLACSALPVRSGPEWLVTDGSGGYAMGTVSGLRTRRYHGLLVVPRELPYRNLAIAALDPVLVLASGERVRLGVHEWADGTISPTGHRLLQQFDLIDGLPRWRWRVGDVVLERRLALEHGTGTLGIVHRLLAGSARALELEAVVTWRDVHGERRAGREPQCSHLGDGVVVEDAFRLSGPGWTPSGVWFENVFMREEADRGLAAVEDLWFAGSFRQVLDGPGSRCEVVAWSGDLDVYPDSAQSIIDGAHGRADSLIRAARATDPVEQSLVLAADAFIVGGPDVIAGYPWFGTWSRDTMTAYEGLFLETGRYDEGRDLLVRYASSISEGMLVNTADTGAPEYNTVDAALWFIHAVDRHVARSSDGDLAHQMLPALSGIAEAYLAGTRFGIRTDTDGLVTQGSAGIALTWMDARFDGVPVTPRAGKAVEVNALWINALAAIRALQRRVHQDDRALADAEQSARAAFARRFVRPDRTLLDVVDGPDGDDASVRPNQLLAVSLPHAPWIDDGPVVGVASLLTPIGLRSLAPSDPAFTGIHRGDQRERDRAYHQGTVWPWLVASYVTAALRTHVPVEGLLDGLALHLDEAGLGSISETADGSAPHAPTGCPFQAWSVAETLRAWRLLNREETYSRRRVHSALTPMQRRNHEHWHCDHVQHAVVRLLPAAEVAAGPRGRALRRSGH